MKIKQELPQFTNSPSLIITTGKQHAIIYLAKNGIITKESEILIKPETYSDKEGHFERRSRNLNLGSGSVYEDDNKEKRIKDFINDIEKELKKYKKIANIYCFCPDYMKNYLLAPISKYRKNPKLFLGNFTDNHPFELLEKI
jgi:hypothetical protein